MIRDVFFLICSGIFLTGISAGCIAQNGNDNLITWKNPISNGINPYGMKDLFMMIENNKYYLVGTEYPDPYHKAPKGPNLYRANALDNWEIACSLIDHASVPDTAWYRDEWRSPEIHRINNLYYLTFNSRNDALRPYKKTGFGIAVSTSLEGPYDVINKNAPLAWSNNGGLVPGNSGETYFYYDMDGRIFIGQVDLEKGTVTEGPTKMLGAKVLQENFKYLDAPQITKTGNVYHLLFSQFYGGYVVKIFHMTARQPTGPWKWSENNPLYRFIEAEADMKVKMTYPGPHGFAPPTQVIFNHQLIRGLNNRFLMVYHSSEKYSEPYLCVEPVELRGEMLYIPAPKSIKQQILK